MSVGDLTHDPLGHDEGVCSLLHRHRPELDLVLHQLPLVLEDVADLAVRVLQLDAHRGEMLQHLLAHQLSLGERRRLLIAVLLLHRVDPLGLVDEVVLELSERLQDHPGLLGQRLGRPADDLLARVRQGLAVLAVEGAQHVE
jgi:hypothetical protein